MPLAFSGDRAARDADLQYLLGPDLPVAPILEAGGKRRLFVPAGRWDRLLALGPVTGPGWVDVECSIEQFPAFVREGSTVSSRAPRG